MADIKVSEIVTRNNGVESVSIVPESGGATLGAADLTIRLEVTSTSGSGSGSLAKLGAYIWHPANPALATVTFVYPLGSNVIEGEVISNEYSTSNTFSPGTTFTHTVTAGEVATRVAEHTITAPANATYFARASISGGTPVLLSGATFTTTAGSLGTPPIIVSWENSDTLLHPYIYYDATDYTVIGSILEQYYSDAGRTTLVTSKSLAYGGNGNGLTMWVSDPVTLTETAYYMRSIVSNVAGSNYEPVDWEMDLVPGMTLSSVTAATNQTPVITGTRNSGTWTTGQTVSFDASLDSTFSSGLTSGTDTVTAGENGTNAMQFSISLPSHGLWYIRAKNSITYSPSFRKPVFDAITVVGNPVTVQGALFQTNASQTFASQTVASPSATQGFLMLITATPKIAGDAMGHFTLNNVKFTSGGSVLTPIMKTDTNPTGPQNIAASALFWVPPSIAGSLTSFQPSFTAVSTTGETFFEFISHECTYIRVDNASATVPAYSFTRADNIDAPSLMTAPNALDEYPGAGQFSIYIGGGNAAKTWANTTKLGTDVLTGLQTSWAYHSNSTVDLVSNKPTVTGQPFTDALIFAVTLRGN